MRRDGKTWSLQVTSKERFVDRYPLGADYLISSQDVSDDTYIEGNDLNIDSDNESDTLEMSIMKQCSYVHLS